MIDGMMRAPLLALLLLAPGGIAAAPAKPSALAVEGAPAGTGYVIRMGADTDLPDGTIVRLRGWRVEGGRPVAASETQLFAEARGGRFEATWTLRREDFRPGPYQFEAILKHEQPDAVAAALTPAQKALRLVGRLDAGNERPPLATALDLCRTLAVSCREIGKAAAAQARHAEAAAAGTLDRKAWISWKASVEPALSAAERTLARKDLLLVLPTASSLAPLLNNARVAMAACDAAAGGAARPDAVPTKYPEEAALGQAMSRLRLDAMELLATSAEDVLRQYTVVHDNREYRVQPLKPDQQALVKRQSELVAASWQALQTLPWWDTLPDTLLAEAESLAKEIRALPSARMTGGALPDAGAGKDAKGGAGGEPAAVLLPRIQERAGKIREVAAAEKAKPAAP
jgi:hypothetical protein